MYDSLLSVTWIKRSFRATPNKLGQQTWTTWLCINTLDGTRISKSRNGEVPTNICHNLGMLASQMDENVCL